MIKKSTPFFTDTVKRFTKWNVFVFLLIILLFNIFLIISLSYSLRQNIDIRLKHEMEKVIASLEKLPGGVVPVSFSVTPSILNFGPEINLVPPDNYLSD